MKSTKNDIKLAIIVTLYNSYGYINNQISSIKKQTVPFDEVIIIDHGSIDQSYEEAIFHAKKLNLECKFYKLEENKGGPAWPRNKGISICSIADYICFNDPDDICLLNRCEVIKEELNNKKHDILVHSLYSFKENINNNNQIKLGYRLNKSFTSNNILGKLYYQDINTPTGCLVISKQKLSENRFKEDVNIIGGEDRFLLMQLVSKNCTLKYLNKTLILYNYGKFTNKKSFRNSLTNRLNSIKIANFLIDFFKSSFKDDVSPRLIITIYYSLLVLRKYSELRKKIKSLGFKKNIAVFFELIRIIVSRFWLFIYSYLHNNDEDIKKYLLSDYVLIKNRKKIKN